MVPVYDKTHVAKTSYGWRTHFDGSSAHEDRWWDGAEDEPRIGSMDDLLGYLSTGEWELVDECGEPATVEGILEHDAARKEGYLCNTRVPYDCYFDRNGYPWSRTEFS